MEALKNIDIRKAALSAGGAALLGLGVHAARAEPITDGKTPIPTATRVEHHPTLVFDDLGGGYPDVFVYPSVKTKDIGNWPEHYAFADGDRVPALCKKMGRLVRSHPEVGERKRSSHWWIRIDGIPTGVTEYATATYVEKPKTLLKKLHTCIQSKK